MFEFRSGQKPMCMDTRYSQGFLQIAESQMMRAGTLLRPWSEWSENGCRCQSRGRHRGRAAPLVHGQFCPESPLALGKSSNFACSYSGDKDVAASIELGSILNIGSLFMESIDLWHGTGLGESLAPFDVSFWSEQQDDTLQLGMLASCDSPASVTESLKQEPDSAAPH